VADDDDHLDRDALQLRDQVVELGAATRLDVGLADIKGAVSRAGQLLLDRNRRRGRRRLRSRRS
jgi:hypothetical protein